MPLDTLSLSRQYRAKLVDVAGQRVLISRLKGSAQEKDLSEPPNAGGMGRVRHFRRFSRSDWPPNPLPLDPACARLGLPRTNELTAQVFQNAACNWRCWYCYVPFDLLAAKPENSTWMRADEIVELYAALPERPPILDLSGGQPELTPEWVLWTIEALVARGLSDSVYLWSDDNLSNDYFWKYLNESQRRRIVSYQNYSRVCCFKGFDPESFAFNTAAESSGFDLQLALFQRYLEEGLDVYAYVTLTHTNRNDVSSAICRFVDRLQQIDRNLPLRTVPLEVAAFSAISSQLTHPRQTAIETAQHTALRAWQKELSERFEPSELALHIDEVEWKRS